MMALRGNVDEKHWYVMRDLKRANAKLPAYKLLRGLEIEVFVPMKWRVLTRRGVRIREEVPFMQDLLFVHEAQTSLDAVVETTPTLQYRWLRGSWRKPMTVADADMERFICAVNATESPRYYLPEEVTAAMLGRRIRITGGLLNGYEGNLISMRGSKVKRLFVELKGFLAAGVEVNPEYIQLI